MSTELLSDSAKSLKTKLLSKYTTSSAKNLVILETATKFIMVALDVPEINKTHLDIIPKFLGDVPKDNIVKTRHVFCDTIDALLKIKEAIADH